MAGGVCECADAPSLPPSLKLPRLKKATAHEVSRLKTTHTTYYSPLTTACCLLPTHHSQSDHLISFDEVGFEYIIVSLLNIGVDQVDVVLRALELQFMTVTLEGRQV